MKKRVKLLLLCAGTVALIFLCVWLKQGQEPVVNGVPLSRALKSQRVFLSDELVFSPYPDAALPHLLKALGERDSFLSKAALAVWAKLPVGLRRALAQWAPIPADQIRNNAFSALRDFGPELQAAVANLIRITEQNGDQRLREDAI